MTQYNLVVVILMAFLFTSAPSFATTDIHFAYVGDNDDALLGVKQGIIEANLQGEFLGMQYHLDMFSVKQFEAVDSTKYLAIYVDTQNSEALMNIIVMQDDKPVFNLATRDDKLRQRCDVNALHVIPSNSMLAIAKQQWQQKQPDQPAEASAWHHTFLKFAARDLNKRFLKKQQRKMTATAYAGWAAIKMTTDTIARSGINTPTKMLDYLRTKLEFDGQKGVKMSFAETGQLMQPILLIHNDRIVAEAPIRGVASPPTIASLNKLKCD